MAERGFSTHKPLHFEESHSLDYLQTRQCMSTDFFETRMRRHHRQIVCRFLVDQGKMTRSKALYCY